MYAVGIGGALVGFQHSPLGVLDAANVIHLDPARVPGRSVPSSPPSVRRWWWWSHGAVVRTRRIVAVARRAMAVAPLVAPISAYGAHPGKRIRCVRPDPSCCANQGFFLDEGTLLARSMRMLRDAARPVATRVWCPSSTLKTPTVGGWSTRPPPSAASSSATPTSSPCTAACAAVPTQECAAIKEAPCVCFASTA